MSNWTFQHSLQRRPKAKKPVPEFHAVWITRTDALFRAQCLLLKEALLAVAKSACTGFQSSASLSPFGEHNDRSISMILKGLPHNLIPGWPWNTWRCRKGLPRDCWNGTFLRPRCYGLQSPQEKLILFQLLRKLIKLFVPKIDLMCKAFRLQGCTP